MHMTATGNHAAKLSTTAGVRRLVQRSDLLTFIHGRPLMPLSFLIILLEKNSLGRLPTLAHCACAAVYRPTNHCRKPFMRTPMAN